MKKSKILHQEQGVTPLTLSLNQWGFHEKYSFPHTAPLKFDYSFLEHHEDTSTNWYGDLENFTAMGEIIIEKLKNDKNYSTQVLKEEISLGKKVIKLSDKIMKEDLTKFNKAKLAKYIGKLYQAGKDLCGVGFVAVVSDLRHYKLSTLLKDIIKKKVEDLKLNININEAFSILITPIKNIFARDLKLDLFELALIVSRQGKSDLAVNDPRIKKLKEKYIWFDFGYVGPSHDEKFYVEEVKEILTMGNIESRLAEAEKELELFAVKQEELVEKLQLSEVEQNLFKGARDIMYNKQYRTETEFKMFFALDLLLDRAAELLEISKVNLHRCSLYELLDILAGKLDIQDLPVAGRKQHCVCIEEPGKKFFYLTGKAAEKYLAENVAQEEFNINTTSVHGMVAYIGEATGKAKVVLTAKDIDKVAEGDILIAVQTSPDFLPAMKKASAFVTDIGGITCHAAIVAREMKKPCVVGSKVATKIFKDNDLVKVDGNNGDVIKLSC